MRRLNRPWLFLMLLCSGSVSSLRLNAQSVNERDVLTGTRLAEGFGVGVTSSGNRTDWLIQDGDAMKMAYPSQQAWGAVFVTFGRPTTPPRPSVDLSAFATLLIEVRGDPGTTIEIGIKDSIQPDDGTEQKAIMPVFANYRTYAIPLTKFKRADLKRVYVAAEFVFSGPQAQTVWVRRIKYTTAAAPNVDGVVNGASFRAGAGAGMWVSLMGQALSGVTRGWADADFQGKKLPKALAGVGVNVNERAMAVAYVSPTQVNALVLHDVPSGQSSYFSVSNSVGTSVPVRVVVQPSFPAFFTLAPEAGRYVAAVHLDGALVGKAGLFGPAVTTRAAKPGDVVQIYGTSFGTTSPLSVADEILPGALPLASLSQVSIRFGSTPASVDWGGLVLPGLYQFNVRVPNVADGDQRLSVDLGSAGIQQEVFLAVQR